MDIETAFHQPTSHNQRLINQLDQKLVQTPQKIRFDKILSPIPHTISTPFSDTM